MRKQSTKTIYMLKRKRRSKNEIKSFPGDNFISSKEAHHISRKGHVQLMRSDANISKLKIPTVGCPTQLRFYIFKQVSGASVCSDTNSTRATYHLATSEDCLQHHDHRISSESTMHLDHQIGLDPSSK